MSEFKVVAYFGPESKKALVDRIAEYPPDALLFLMKHGDSYAFAVEGQGDDDPINDSHVCPGSPGCPH